MILFLLYLGIYFASMGNCIVYKSISLAFLDINYKIKLSIFIDFTQHTNTLLKKTH